MKIIRRAEENVGFQLAPMIDMTFLLLIFFMVTTKISKEQIKEEIKLPVASNAIIPPEVSNRDVISIDGAGRYFIGQTPAGKKIKEVMKMAADAGALDVIFGSYQS
jgi:biopolymer transport protein ExbD